MTASNITIRRVQGGDLFERTHFLRSYAFSPTPPIKDLDTDDMKAWWAHCQASTETFVLLAGEEPLAAASHVPLQHNIRGQLYDAWGLWGVATHPAARRNGYARQVLQALLRAGYKDGIPISVLYPFRESFYERLGYVSFPQPRRAVFKVAHLAPLLRWELPGQVELVSTRTGYGTWRDYLHGHLPQVHGWALAESGWPQSWLEHKDPFWLALARVDGTPVGAMIYRLEGPEGAFNMRVRGFYTRTLAGRYLLLEWIARHIDHAGEVSLHLPPYEHPEGWLPDLKVTWEAGFAPMGRVLNVAALGGMATGPGRFTARLHDPHCPWNAGAWAFETVDGVLTVCPADAADCDLNIQALSALMYGTQDPAVFALRDWGNPIPATQAVMRAMFPPRLPFLYEQF
jgi:predicted acetyltransferase